MSSPSTSIGDQRTAISNGIVAFHIEQFGRGPERTRTVIAGDVVTCVLEGVLTSAESSLMDGGESVAVSGTRTKLQYVGKERFVQIVEDVTGRRVREFISGIDPEGGGTAVEVFVLEPRLAPALAG
jgi:uncharacterized protein YbcI